MGELPQMVFLHGNVGIGICLEDRVKGFMVTLAQMQQASWANEASVSNRQKELRFRPLHSRRMGNSARSHLTGLPDANIWI